MSDLQQDKIAAIATGNARSGIGIIRMTGEGCIEAAAQVFECTSGKPLSGIPDRKLVLGTVFDAQGRPIDHCMAFISRAPHSYTGEDTAEFQCHGSPAALTAALLALFAAGFRQARAGEFTRRAFLNGRLDLTQAEAVIDLIDAPTAEAAANAAGQLSGAIGRKIAPVYESLVDLLSHFHAVLDYPDEDLDPFEIEQAEKTITDAYRVLAQLLSTAQRGQFIANGIRAAIVGSPNAGKSSLLNLLAGFSRVIVTDTPGTTRDTVEQAVTLGRHYLRLIDTAGIRDASDEIERMGVTRSEEAARDCPLVLYLLDASKPLSSDDKRAMDLALDAPAAVAILNKSDLPQVIFPSDLPFDCVVPFCAKTGEGLSELEQAIDMVFPDDSPCDGSLLTNARQIDAVRRAMDALKQAHLSLQAGLTPDAVLVDAEDAMQALGELTGAIVREDITNRIFERFCVGK